MKHLLVTIAVLISYTSNAQYWFGPKIGYSYIDHVYQESTYESDTAFTVPKDFNYQAGIALSYTATSRYSVYGELLYERVGKEVTDSPTGGDFVTTKMTNHFLSAPIMLRVTLGTVPFHYFVNGGPRLAYWLGGNGSIKLEELAEAFFDEDGNPIPVDYKIVFNSSRLGSDRSTAFVSKPNRLQFGLTLGGGVFFDIQGGSRLQLDFRFTWVHSNMGTNNGFNDTNFNDETYRENFEYFHNIGTLGITYMFGYDSQLRRKGKSTVSKSNKKKKK